MTNSESFKTRSKEVAVSENSMFYTPGDFPKYNPDDLIGRKGATIYKKMYRDEQIKACLKFKSDAIISRGYVFELDHEKEGLTEEEATRRICLFEKIVKDMDGSFNDTLRKILSAFRNGFSVSEKVYKDIEYEGLAYRGLKDVKLKPADTFNFAVDEFGNLINIEQQVLGQRNRLDADKFVHFVINPDIDEHYGESELRSCYRAWFSKDVAIKLRNIYLERHAGGFHVLKPPKDTRVTPGTQEYNNLVNLLGNITTKTGVLLPSSEYVLEGQYPTGTGGDLFEKTIDQSDTQISRALLVPNLLGITPAGQTGSYSQSQTQLDAFFWTLGNDSDRLAECINDQLFRSLGLVNFADGIYPIFKWNPLSKTKAIEIIRLFLDLVNAGVVDRYDQDEDFIRSSLNLPSVAEYIKNDEKEAASSSEGNEEESKDDEKNEGEKRDDDEESQDYQDETITGTHIRVNHAVMKKATSRVNFARIGMSSEDIVEDNVKRLAVHTDAIAKTLVEQIKAGGDLETEILSNFKKAKIPPKMKTKLNSQVTQVLKQGESFGRKEAAKEIDKAMKKSFSMSADYKRMNFIAEDYFKAASFRITGNLTDAMIKIIENEILNGARYGKSWDEIEIAIYSTMASKGLVSPEFAREILGDALKLENPDARLRTIVRTSTFEAINTARDSYFTDPQLGDFVRAYEYSAILDGRTTPICRHLDDANAGDHSIEWYNENAGYKPPNHYNCRSLLVAVTVNDLSEYEEGPEPSLEPMEGFK